MKERTVMLQQAIAQIQEKNPQNMFARQLIHNLVTLNSDDLAEPVVTGEAGEQEETSPITFTHAGFNIAPGSDEKFAPNITMVSNTIADILPIMVLYHNEKCAPEEHVASKDLFTSDFAAKVKAEVESLLRGTHSMSTHLMDMGKALVTYADAKQHETGVRLSMSLFSDGAGQAIWGATFQPIRLEKHDQSEVEYLSVPLPDVAPIEIYSINCIVDEM